jgi:protein-S-isoprenylcysteine O-methyltransferase Ste14
MVEELYNYALIGIFTVTAIIAFALFFITAPYGRHARPGWGKPLKSSTGWIIMETPAVATISILFFSSQRTGVLTFWIFWALWQSHYLYRTYIYPFKLKGNKNSIPWTIVLMAITFNIWNGFLNGAWLFYISDTYTPNWFLTPQFTTGTTLFFAGMIINRQSDKILLNLRTKNENGYKIPSGGLYRFVSMPAYSGELIQWTGWAILTWSWAGASFALFTAANLIPRAIANHKWYKKTFKNYPRERKAIIPFIL